MQKKPISQIIEAMKEKLPEEYHKTLDAMIWRIFENGRSDGFEQGKDFIKKEMHAGFNW